jgi:hypothetical protein
VSPAKRPRRHFFVDPKVQGTLIARVIAYWVVCLISIALMLVCWNAFCEPGRPLAAHLRNVCFLYGPALAASCVLLPLVIIDIVRFSNRFVGPLLRLRRSMRQLGRGEPTDAIVFRDIDFWQDFADEFNTVRARLNDAESGKLTSAETTEQTASSG